MYYVTFGPDRCPGLGGWYEIDVENCRGFQKEDVRRLFSAIHPGYEQRGTIRVYETKKELEQNLPYDRQGCHCAWKGRYTLSFHTPTECRPKMTKVMGT